MTTPSLRTLRGALRDRAEPAVRIQQARVLRPPDDDELLGVRVPAVRQLARAHRELAREDVDALLHSRVHEERLAGVLVLAERMRTARGAERRSLVDFYLARTRCVDNWDLVDASAHLVLGPWLVDGPEDPPAVEDVLDGLAASSWLWDRRIAVVATLALVRAGRFEPTFHLVRVLCRDPEPLIHKALGWMLREIGRRDAPLLVAFLDQHVTDLPRVTVRYATERLPAEDRARFVRARQR
ncbi:DNA alkylation repair protein [Streptomyces dubilierae]|uniref:DNA alkylation repair protein n=1 Tax=Streptomyces dubilierae TaxID=3075533 RepID=A0ABU2P8V2_9ACTN|nr:DNA alkylation repair protein [Streptomyces sp. DSM 41921]MDT0388583.1 DNA alkylation repair protein [Streptomyces sp. DSM 41921]